MLKGWKNPLHFEFGPCFNYSEGPTSPSLALPLPPPRLLLPHRNFNIVTFEPTRKQKDRGNVPTLSPCLTSEQSNVPCCSDNAFLWVRFLLRRFLPPPPVILEDWFMQLNLLRPARGPCSFHSREKNELCFFSRKSLHLSILKRLRTDDAVAREIHH